MKKIVLVLIPLLSLICKAEGNRSVTLIIEVDSFICQETQMAYLYDIVGNDYIIYDSIMLVPDRYQYQLSVLAHKLTTHQRGWSPYKLSQGKA